MVQRVKRAERRRRQREEQTAMITKEEQIFQERLKQVDALMDHALLIINEKGRRPARTQAEVRAMMKRIGPIPSLMAATEPYPDDEEGEPA